MKPVYIVSGGYVDNKFFLSGVEAKKAARALRADSGEAVTVTRIQLAKLDPDALLPLLNHGDVATPLMNNMPPDSVFKTILDLPEKR